MTTYSYPTSRELTEIGQDFLGPMTLSDPIFQYFPVRNVDSHLLEWEQRDNYKGLQQVRGLNGEPGRVNAIGGRRYRMEPGVYGEFIPLREDELTTRRAWGDQMERPIDLTPVVTEKTEQLVTREVARMRQILWTLVATGTFSVANEHGAPLEIPYASIGVFLIGALGVGMTLALPGRYRFVWTEPKARRAIIIGLGQMCATGLAIALAGYVLAGAWIDVTKPGQFIVAWVFYGLVAAGLGQSFVAVSAFALLLMKRGLPDLGD